ncbi:MAG TPA: hypothetical protein VFF06_00585 [Polyangia bacterium]|nr:hypothetical protein [Polyangia bacterium]
MTPGSPASNPADAAVDAATAPVADLASAGSPAANDLAGGAPAGAKAFGATCTVDGDCASGMCRGFVMQTVFRCTQPCTVATQTQDCPNPPSAGLCTGMGYCKFIQ